MTPSIHSWNHPENLKLMLQLGVITDETEELDAYLAWGKIIYDPVCRPRRLATAEGTVAEALAEMTPAEKLALRDRVLGVLPFEQGRNS